MKGRLLWSLLSEDPPRASLPRKLSAEECCFSTVVLEKTLESPLDHKEIQPVHPKGDQS